VVPILVLLEEVEKWKGKLGRKKSARGGGEAGRDSGEKIKKKGWKSLNCEKANGSPEEKGASSAEICNKTE